MFNRRKIKNVADVAAWQLCCGCGACAYSNPEAIEMIDTLEYGRRPRFRDGADISSARESMVVCPGIELTRPPIPNEMSGQEDIYKVWGPVLGVWEGHAADSQIRFEGSSGGVATALALYALEKQKMAGALHIKARKDIRYLNQTVFSQHRDQLLAGAGSRYAPASPCDGLQQIEDATAPCVFIGKPCDVVAVRKATTLRPKLAEKIGLTISFFCAGTPSTQGSLNMLQKMGVEDLGSIISLRYRGHGWPGLATVEYKDKDGNIQQRQLTYEQSWGDILQKYRQWRCYICPDHIGEFADIAVADAWHRPVGEHQPGRSVIIARTHRGKVFLEQAIQDGFLSAEIVLREILPLCRPGQETMQGNLWARIQTLRIMRLPIPKYYGYDFFRLWISELLMKEKIRSVYSTIKRIFAKKLRQRRTIIPFNTFDGDRI
ncbi:MAG TPA: Coenzyme F420 hydrogenase/dehydrogenase, beta subunit C-terminal domain [Anaerohalosphaeraceae bacterium]|nr:Coenzyme F420 hydrogenase/dehydrogenase, beta subunit C-terminal domain [Anaerohalosphaeraceae bacterium]